MNNKIRILEIKKKLKKFEGLNIGKFAYCETAEDFISASYFNNSVESCIEVTKHKPHLKEIHKKLNIFHSLMLELIKIEK